jgi:hypothetical protein
MVTTMKGATGLLKIIKTLPKSMKCMAVTGRIRITAATK